MKSKVFTKTIVCTAVVLYLSVPMAGSASSSPDDRIFNKRWYLGAGAGLSELKPEPTTDSLSITEKRGNSFSLSLGYDLSPRFSIDAYAGSLGDAEVSFLGTPVGNIDYTVYGLSLISYLHNAGSPYSSRYDDDGLYQREGLSTYLRLGVGGMINDADTVDYKRDYKTHFAAGLGIEYGWSNGIALRTELSSYDTDARQLSLSILKRFGDSSYAHTAAAVVPTIIASSPEPVPVVKAAPALGRPMVLFGFDENDIQPYYVARLDSLARTLLEYPELRVEIAGHTDWVGSGGYNMALSEYRANSVQSFLMDRGVAADQLQSKGYGELVPIADNDSPQGRARNRRVEISRLR